MAHRGRRADATRRARHRDGARVVAGAYLFRTHAITDLLERAIEVLEREGFSRDMALHGSITVMRYTMGIALDDQASPTKRRAEIMRRLDEGIPVGPHIDAERWPRVAEVMGRWIKQVFVAGVDPASLGELHFRHGLALVMAGIRSAGRVHWKKSPGAPRIHDALPLIALGLAALVRREVRVRCGARSHPPPRRAHSRSTSCTSEPAVSRASGQVSRLHRGRFLAETRTAAEAQGLLASRTNGLLGAGGEILAPNHRTLTSWMEGAAWARSIRPGLFAPSQFPPAPRETASAPELPTKPGTRRVLRAPAARSPAQ